MNRASLPGAEREMYSKLKKILDQPGVLRGCLVESRRTCGHPSCRCHEDRRYRHRSLYVGVSMKGKQRTVCVPWSWEQRVREWVDRYDQIRELLERLSLASLERLQARRE